MRNRMLQLAGLLVLLAVIGKFYAVPAIAQVVRAALVQSRDEPGRNYYSATASCSYVQSFCTLSFPAVPVGKRLIVQNVNGFAYMFANGNDLALLSLSLYSTGESKAWVPTSTLGANPSLQSFNQSVLVSFDAGQQPEFRAVTVHIETPMNLSVWISGYMIDIP